MTFTGQFPFPGLLRGICSELSCGGQSSNRRSGKNPREKDRAGPGFPSRGFITVIKERRKKRGKGLFEFRYRQLNLKHEKGGGV